MCERAYIAMCTTHSFGNLREGYINSNYLWLLYLQASFSPSVHTTFITRCYVRICGMMRELWISTASLAPNSLCPTFCLVVLEQLQQATLFRTRSWQTSSITDLTGGKAAPKGIRMKTKMSGKVNKTKNIASEIIWMTTTP